MPHRLVSCRSRGSQPYPHNPRPQTLAINAVQLLPRIEQIGNALGAWAVSRDVEEIAASYVQAAEGDAEKALRMAVHDAIGGLADAECRIGEADRLISRGYVRGRITPLGRVLGEKADWLQEPVATEHRS
jgi:hypothetical protein